MWGVSWANVKLMMADSIRTHIDTEDESKKKDQVFDLGTQSGFDQFKRTFND